MRETIPSPFHSPPRLCFIFLCLPSCARSYCSAALCNRLASLPAATRSGSSPNCSFVLASARACRASWIASRSTGPRGSTCLATS
ncbi:hypothetical protein GGR53DRAFT_482090 [Hypoxylon sp. FL1150]|nr:hypothetical protein GGR53DRAFT_482090 [Hypoxylon sp. FL1150]